MEMPSPVEYYFSAVHKRNQGNTHCQFSYAKVLKLTLLKQFEEATPFYDKSSKMWFQSSDTYSTYCIEVEDVNLSFDNRYKKAEEFFHRMQYIYNGIMVKVKSNGKIQSVENIGELRTNWNVRKDYILKDYQGSGMSQYLNETTINFERDDHFIEIFNQYQIFGLLFLNIPLKHHEQYTRERIVTINEQKGIIIAEQAIFEGIKDAMRHYTLTAKAKIESKLHLQAYCGNVWYNESTAIMQKAELTISYGNSWQNDWTFNIYRIDN